MGGKRNRSLDPWADMDVGVVRVVRWNPLNVEPPKLNVKTYNKCVVKTKKVNQPLTTVVSTKMKVTLEQLNHFKLPLKTLEIAFQRP